MQTQKRGNVCSYCLLFDLKFGIPNHSTFCTFLVLLSDVSRRYFEFSSQGASFLSYTVKPQFSNILILKQFRSWASFSWGKCLSCLTKLWVSVLYLTTLSCWYLCDQPCISGHKEGDLVFLNKSFLKQLSRWIKFKNWGFSTVTGYSILWVNHRFI